MTDSQVLRSSRNGTADLLKGFAVLLMIQVHLMEQFVTPEIRLSLIGRVSMFLGGPFCAPVFLAVMGFFMASQPKPLVYFLKRGAILFLGGVLLNVTRSANLLIHISEGEIDLNPWHFVLGADILTLAGLTLVLTGFLTRGFGNKSYLYLLTALVIAFLSPFLQQPADQKHFMQFVIAFLYGDLSWSYFPLFPWFSYVLAGYACRLFISGHDFIRRRELLSNPLYLMPFWAGTIITLPFALRITNQLEGPGGYYHHGILLFLWMMLFIVGYVGLIGMAESNYGRRKVMVLVKWIGEKVTLLYVIQWLLIGNLATWLYGSQGLYQFPLWFAGITILTLVLGFLANKIISLPGIRSLLS